MKKIKVYLNNAVVLVLLICFISCNADFRPSFKASITDSQMRSHVSRAIDAQLENIKQYLDEDLQKQIEEGSSSRSVSGLSGEDIVDLTLLEDGGRDYLDFCYAVDYAQATLDVDAVMDTAKCVLSDSDFQDLCDKAQDMERSMMAIGEEASRAIPLNQQAAFYKDLKILVTRSIVLLVAGVVYASIPDLVFWGKVSAAAAISIGAGLVAISIMSLYEYYRFGTGEGKSFETWFKELLEIPKADFALTATVSTISEAMGCGPVVTGIIICVFGLYNIVGMVRTMMQTYNFNA